MERIQDIAHLGSVELLTPNLDGSVWYFRDVLGMSEVHRAERSVYLRSYGDYALTTLKLMYERQNGATEEVEVLFTSEQLDDLIAKAEKAKQKLQVLEQSFGRWVDANGE